VPMIRAPFPCSTMVAKAVRVFQALTELCQKLRIIAGRPGAEEPDHRHRWLLRTSRDWPSRRGTAEKHDELAPFHSITALAAASSAGGMVRPSPSAVLRLMTSSILVGACTGRSAAFSPLRIRSM
jgi:hypothetical protein